MKQYRRTFLSEESVDDVGDFFPKLFRVGDRVERLHFEVEIPRTLGVVVELQKFTEVEMVRIDVEHVLPHAARHAAARWRHDDNQIPLH